MSDKITALESIQKEINRLQHLTTEMQNTGKAYVTYFDLETDQARGLALRWALDQVKPYIEMLEAENAELRFNQSLPDEFAQYFLDAVRVMIRVSNTLSQTSSNPLTCQRMRGRAMGLESALHFMELLKAHQDNRIKTLEAENARLRNET